MRGRLIILYLLIVKGSIDKLPDVLYCSKIGLNTYITNGPLEIYDLVRNYNLHCNYPDLIEVASYLKSF